MRTPVILLSSLLFHWAAASHGIRSETQQGRGVREGRLEWLNTAEEESNVSNVGGEETSLGDGRQKSRPARAGLTRREIGSVEEAWRGTDWGGSSLPRFADRQELDRKKRDTPPVISLLGSNLEETELKHGDRNRRSLISDPQNDEAIRKILVNAKEKLSDVKSKSTIDDDWIFFVLPSRSGTLTESLFRPASNGPKIGGQSWRQNEKWLDDKEFLNANNNKFDYNEDVVEAKGDPKKYDEPPLSDWNIDEKTGGTNFALTKGGRNKQRSSKKNDEDYRGIKVNVDAKNGETYGDISIDNTVSDKPSAAEISVKIPEARYNKATIRNNRPSNDKSRLVSDPFVFLAELEGGAARRGDKGSSRESNPVMRARQNSADGKLIESKVEEKRVGKRAEFSSDESRLNKENGGRMKMDDELLRIEEARLKRGERNYGELQVSRLLEELSNMRNQMGRNQNLYERNERNLGSNPSRVERIDARDGIRVKYDKQKSAAETSIPLDVNERGGVKRRERVEERSTVKNGKVDGEWKREKEGDEPRKEAVKGRDDYDSDENVKVKWTSLKGEREAIADVDKERLDKLGKKTVEGGNSEIRGSQQVDINNKTNLRKVKSDVENLKEKDNQKREKQDSKVEYEVKNLKVDNEDRRKDELENVKGEKSIKTENRNEYEVPGIGQLKVKNENSRGKLREKFDKENLKKIIFGVKIPKIKGIEDFNINSEDFRLENLNWIEYKGENLDTEDNEGNLRRENEIEKNIDNNLNRKNYEKRNKFKINDERGQNIEIDNINKHILGIKNIEEEKSKIEDNNEKRYNTILKTKKANIKLQNLPEETFDNKKKENDGKNLNRKDIKENNKDKKYIEVNKTKRHEFESDDIKKKEINKEDKNNQQNIISDVKKNIKTNNLEKQKVDEKNLKKEKIDINDSENKNPEKINKNKFKLEDIEEHKEKILNNKHIEEENLKRKATENEEKKDGIDNVKRHRLTLKRIQGEKLKNKNIKEYTTLDKTETNSKIEIPQNNNFKIEKLKKEGSKSINPKIEKFRKLEINANKFQTDKTKGTDYNVNDLKTKKSNNEEIIDKNKKKTIDEQEKSIEVDNAKKYKLNNVKDEDFKDEKTSVKKENKEKYDNSKLKEIIEIITPQNQKFETENLKNERLDINIPKIELKEVKKDDNKHPIDKIKWTDYNKDNLKTKKSNIEDTIKVVKWKGIDELKKNTEIDTRKKNKSDEIENERISVKNENKEKYDNSKVKKTSTEVKTPQDQKFGRESMKNEKLQIINPRIYKLSDIKLDNNKFQIGKWTDYSVDDLNTKENNNEDTLEKYIWKGIDELLRKIEIYNARKSNLDNIKDKKISLWNRNKEGYDISNVKDRNIETNNPKEQKIPIKNLEEDKDEIINPKIDKFENIKVDDIKFQVGKWTDYNIDKLKTKESNNKEILKKDKWKRIDELNKNTKIDNRKRNKSDDIKDESIKNENKEKYDNSKVKEANTDLRPPQNQKLGTENLKNEKLEIVTPKIEAEDITADDNKLPIDKIIKEDKWKGIDELKKNTDIDTAKKYKSDDIKDERISVKNENKEKHDNSKVVEANTDVKTPQNQKFGTENLENKEFEIITPKTEVEDIKTDDNKLPIDKTIKVDKWKRIDELTKNTETDTEKKYKSDDIKDERISVENENKEKHDSSKVVEASTDVKTPQNQIFGTDNLKNEGLEIVTPKIEVKDVKTDDNKLPIDKIKWIDYNVDNLKTKKNNIEDTIKEDKWKGINELKKNTETDTEKKYKSDDIKDERMSVENENKEKHDSSKVVEASNDVKTPQNQKFGMDNLKNEGLEIVTPKIEVKDVKTDDNKLPIDKIKWIDYNVDNLKTKKNNIEDTIKEDKWKGIDELKKNTETDTEKKYKSDDIKDERMSVENENKEKHDSSKVVEASNDVKTPQNQKFGMDNLKNEGLEIVTPKIEVKDVKTDDNKLPIDKIKWIYYNVDNLKTKKNNIEDTIKEDKWKGIDELKKNTETDTEKKYKSDDIKDERISVENENKEKHDNSKVVEASTDVKTPQNQKFGTENLENKGFEIITSKTEVEDIKTDDNKLPIDKTIKVDKWKRIDELTKNTEADTEKKYKSDDIKDESISVKNENKEKYDNSKVKETSTDVKTPQNQKFGTENLENEGLEIITPKTEVEDIKADDNKLPIDKIKWIYYNVDNLKTKKNNIEDTIKEDKWKGIDELKKNTETDTEKKYKSDDIKDEKISVTNENKEKYDNSKVKETSTEVKTPQNQKFGTDNLKNKGLEIVTQKIEVKDVKTGDNKLPIDKIKWIDYNVDNLKTKKNNIEDTIKEDKWKGIDELKKNTETDTEKKYKSDDIKDERISVENENKDKHDSSKVVEASTDVKTPQNQKFGTENLENEGFEIITPKTEVEDIKTNDNKLPIDKTKWTVNKKNNIDDNIIKDAWKGIDEVKKNIKFDRIKKYKSDNINDEKISTKNKDIEKYDDSKVKVTEGIETPHEKKFDIGKEYVLENKLESDDVFRPKLKNVVEKESKIKDNNEKEYISNINNEKLEDENTSEKEFQLQKLNEGDKLKDLREEKNDRKISAEEDLEIKNSKIEDTEKDKFRLQNKIGNVIQKNEKLKSEGLKVKEIGLKNSREKYIFKDKKESGSVNLKNDKNQLSVIEKFKPHLDNNVLWSSKENDKNSDQSVVNDSNASPKKEDIIRYDDKYEKEGKKYGTNENFEDSSVKVRNDNNLKEDFSNKDTTYKKEDLYVTRDNTLENSNKRNKSGKQDYEVISYKKPLNEEHKIFENKSTNNNEKLISNEEVIYKDGNADKISQYENKLKEDLIEKNDENRIKQAEPSSVKEGTNETSNIRKKGNEEFDKEILKSSKVENDSLKDDDKKKDLKLERTFDENTLTTDENNVLIKREELQTVPILSEKTKVAKKKTFGNAGTNNKDTVLSEQTKLEDKKPLNDFEIHTDKNKGLKNNDIDIARATEQQKFNKLSKYKNDNTIKTINIESNRLPNDIVINSRQTDSADKITEILGKNGKESNKFQNLNRTTTDSLDITNPRAGSLTNSKGNEDVSGVTTVAHVAKLNENKALHSSEDDTSEVETSTKSNSDTSAIVNRTADKGQIEIRGSSVNLSELSDIDVHPPEHSDTLGKKDNPSLVSRTVSVDDNEIGENKIPRNEGSSNVDVRKKSKESREETGNTRKESENILPLNDSKKNGEESKREKKIGIQSVNESTTGLSKESDFEKIHDTINKFDDKPTDSAIQTDTKETLKKADDTLYTSRKEEGNSEKTKENESSGLNSNIDILPKILIGNKEADLVGQRETMPNDANSKQTTVSSSTWGSKFPGNNGTLGERNISSNAINQPAEEELEKEKITWRDAAVDHPPEENDSEMINLSFTNNSNDDKNKIRDEKKGGADEKSRTDDTNFSKNIIDLLIKKNSKELENYYNGRSIDKYGTNESRNRLEESKIDSPSLKDVKKERVTTTRKDGLNEKSGEKDVWDESESITGDLNKKKVFKEGSNGGITQVTESNDVTGESEDSSSPSKDEVSLSDLSVESFGKNDKLGKKQLDLSIKGERKSEDGDEIIRSGTRGSNKTPSTTRQLIEDNELEQFLPTSIQTALNTKTTSQVYPSDVDENPITSRLPQDVTAHAFNWTDNERYKELPNKVIARIPEKTQNNIQIYDSASRLPKLETGDKLSKLAKQTGEKKVENAKENDEKGEKFDVTKLKNVEEEKEKSKNTLNESNDIGIKNNRNAYVDEIGSLNESKIGSDAEDNRREGKNSLQENDKLNVQGKNIERKINNEDLTNNYDKNHRSEILTDENVAKDRDNLLKNAKLIGRNGTPEKEEKNSVLKLLLGKEKIKKVRDDNAKKLRIGDDNNDKRDESKEESKEEIKIIPDKLNKETFKTKLNQQSKNYKDKLPSAKYRIARPNENLDEILDDERETQIQKTLTESEIAITELPRLKQNEEENKIEEKEKTNSKVGRTSNENQSYKAIYNADNETTIENQKEYNIVSNQLHSTEKDLKSKDEILKEHEIEDKLNLNTAPNILIKPYHISTLDKNDFVNSALSDLNKKIYESKIKDQLINDQTNLKKNADSDSSIKSDAIKNGSRLDDFKNTIPESNIKDALNFNVKDDARNILIKSTDASNVAKNELHNEYKNSILSDSRKIIHEPKAENELKIDIKDNNIFKSNDTSTTINNNLIIKDENSILNHPKQVKNYESNVKDRSRFDLKKDINSDTLIEPATINDLNTDSILSDTKTYESKIPKESKLDLKKDTDSGIPSIKSQHTSAPINDLNANDSKDSKDSKILIFKSKIPNESKLDLKKDIGSDTSVKSIAINNNSDKPTTFDYKSNSINNSINNSNKYEGKGDSENLKPVKNTDNDKNYESFQAVRNQETPNIPKPLDQHWTRILLDQSSPTNKIATNNPAKIPSISSPVRFSLDEKERNLKSRGPLSRVSQTTPSNEISVEIPNAKLVKKLQPSFWKLAKPQTGIVNKSEQPVPVSLNEFKSRPDEKDSDRSVKFSSYTSPGKVSGAGAKNDDLYTVLKSLSLFTRFRDDSKDKKVLTAAHEDRVSTTEDAPKVGSVERMNDKSSSIPQESNRVDVYIVKQASEGPVRIAHIDNTKPLVVTSEEISRSSYEKVIDILERNGIKTDISAA